jgi:hypothetical protein
VETVERVTCTNQKKTSIVVCCGGRSQTLETLETLARQVGLAMASKAMRGKVDKGGLEIVEPRDTWRSVDSVVK